MPHFNHALVKIRQFWKMRRIQCAEVENGESVLQKPYVHVTYTCLVLCVTWKLS